MGRCCHTKFCIAVSRGRNLVLAITCALAEIAIAVSKIGRSLVRIRIPIARTEMVQT